MNQDQLDVLNEFVFYLIDQGMLDRWTGVKTVQDFAMTKGVELVQVIESFDVESVSLLWDGTAVVDGAIRYLRWEFRDDG